MNDFSVTKTAFSGYGVFFGKPMLSLVLALFGVATAFGVAAMAVSVAGPELAQMNAANEAARSGAAPDQAAMMAAMGPVMMYALLSLIVGVVTSSMNNAAANRAVLRPKDSRFPFLGFLGDELRLSVVTIVSIAIIGIPSLIVAIIGVIVVSIAGIASAGPGAMERMAEGGGQPPMVMILTLSVFGVVGLIAFLTSVRVFGLATSQTVGERAIRLFGSWELLKGRYWKTIGALLLAVIPLAVLVAAGIGALYGIAVATGVDPKTLRQPDYSTMEAITAPLALARYLVTGVLGALGVVVLNATTANIYLALAEGTEGAAALSQEEDEDWDDE